MNLSREPGVAMASSFRVILDEPGLPHYHMQQKTERHYWNGEEEEDDGVALLILHQKLGKNPTQRNNNSCSA